MATPAALRSALPGNSPVKKGAKPQPTKEQLDEQAAMGSPGTELEFAL